MHASARASSSASRLGHALGAPARYVRLSIVQGSAPHAQQRRSYAMPVNPGSSVDAMLGTSVPPPPRQGVEIETSKYYRPHNPNDLSDLLNPSKAMPFGNKGRNSSTADLQRIKGTAIGAERKGTPIPSRDEMLDEMFKRPFKEIEEKAKTVVDREQPHPIDAMHGRNELDERVLAAARALHAAGSQNIAASSASASQRAVVADKMRSSTIPGLLHQFEERAGVQLSIELPYESTPSEARRVKLTSASSTEEELQKAEDDGVLLLAYVTNLHAGRGKERISVCSGFAVEGGDRMVQGEGDGKGSLVVSCAHTLRAAGIGGSKSKSSKKADQDEGSIALAITRTGAIYPIRTLVSSLGASDIVLLQLGEEALTLHGNARAGIRTLPISPYPATVNTELSVSSFWGWEDDSGAVLPAYSYDDERGHLAASAATPSPPQGRERERVKLERDDAGRSRWGRARLVEYKDPCGGQALTGTYDELAQLDYKLLLSSPANPPALQGDSAMQMSSAQTTAAAPTVIASPSRRRQPLPNFPPPGSSGGPVVDVESGSVVGVVRGHKMSPLEGRRGDAIPAEKIFEFFALPGLGKKN